MYCVKISPAHFPNEFELNLSLTLDFLHVSYVKLSSY